MSVHVHVHFDHGHDGLVARIGRELSAAYDWLAGPGMSEQEKLHRALAEARNDRHGNGVL